ncbi:MAG: hypothetical protein GC149_15125 [Gammaproteobacteria bacterium]|nr:hypothetical protein [Gammaproteobacteria bacterium]
MAFSEGKTTIVLGAGASSEAGLPVGRDLKSKIARLIDIKYKDGFSRTSGSREIDTAFRIKLQNENGRDLNPYLHACWRIRDAMPQAISIDNYLDAHANDELTVVAGKLGIAQSILEAEKSSSLYVNRREGREMINFDKVENTWYNKFVQLLTENCRVDDLSNNLANLTVISFNYDRCFEHFLYYAIQNYYRVNSTDAAKMLSSLSVYHPYGRVGSLPWQRQEIPIEFGADPHPQSLLDISAQIRTFTEGTNPDTSSIDLIRNSVAECDRLIFLGFAFHPMNMNLLSSEGAESAPKVSYGTALGLSNSDRDIVEREIKSLTGNDIKKVELRNDLTCSQLLDEYRRSLTSI